jgi:hypothetical protein
MFDVYGNAFRSCDGVTRRRVLSVGTLALGGLTLADWLRLRARAAAPGRPARDTAVIQIYLDGGLSHLDSYDPKPDAPAEYRGELGAIASAVPGLTLGELLPGQARLTDRLAIVRGLHHTASDHGAGSHWVLTGHPSIDPNPLGNDRPSVGSVVARLRGANRTGLPPYVSLPRPPAFGLAGYLGPGFNPFGLDGGNDAEARVRDLDPPAGVSLDRVADRRALLSRLDRIDRRRDASGTMAGMDRFTADAYAMITGPAARRAFDLSREAPRVRDRYGRGRIGASCLLARRLVEAGVTFVTVVDGSWDHHTRVFAGCRTQLPPLDRALAALVADLHHRGLAERVLVLVWGEFGRTPRVNGRGGRDHWPGAFSAMLAGGGLKSGQIVGSTGRKGESPSDRPVGPEDVLQTVYHVLGIDPSHEFDNEAGRPIPILTRGRPIAELI